MSKAGRRNRGTPLLTTELAQAVEVYRHAAAAAVALRHHRKALAKRLHEEGFRQRDIAKLMGLSWQRVYQLVSKQN